LRKTIATSPLVKPLFGADANWGRIMAASARAGVPISPEKIEIGFDGLCVAKNGGAVPFSEKKAKKILQQKIVPLTVHLHQGQAEIRYKTCDLSIDYIKINADYRS